jgi:hypothetical protein
MKQINQFIIKSVSFGVIAVLVIAVLTYGISICFKQYKMHSYFLGVIDKHEIFEKRNTKNNLIIIGGSSNAFGIDSKEIQKALNIPVMNFGVHGDFGSEFYYSEAKKEAKSGDVVLANIEYELTSDSVR